MFSQTLLMDLFMSSLRTVNIFIIAILKSLSYALAILRFSGTTVVGLLCPGVLCINDFVFALVSKLKGLE